MTNPEINLTTKSNVKPQRRRYTVAASVLAVLLAIPLVGYVFVRNYDWNKAKPWFSAKASEAIGRPFRIDGDLSVGWDSPAAAVLGQATSWRDWIPTPHLVAKDIHIGNPIAAGDMASAKEFSFSLNPIALLAKRIAIPVLRFESPAVQLERTADGNNNWTIQKQPASAWTLDLERVIFTKGVIQLTDAVKKANVTVDVDTIYTDNAYGVAWQTKGDFNGEKVTGSGMAGAVLSLQQQTIPYPLMADMRIGATHIRLEGTLTKPTELAALDMQMSLSGASMARLYRLTGVLLPETPPYSTQGHLTGQLGTHTAHWVYDHFKGRVGASDLSGKIDYQSRQPRGLLTAELVSHVLKLTDLGPIIGADNNASKLARGAAPVQPLHKILPAESFKTERWRSVDADVKFTADQIIRDKKLPINQLYTQLHLRDGVITLTPLSFEVAGGTLRSDITLDGSGSDSAVIKAQAKTSVHHVQVKQLFPSLDALQASVGEINGEASLSATGGSVATLLGNANGEVKTSINQGSISKLLLEKMGLNIGSIIISKIVGDRQIKLNCMANDFVVTNGVMQVRSFVVDTEDAIIDVSGTINLATEELNLTINPKAKGVRIFSLRSPLYISGSFQDPQVHIDKSVMALRAGGAVALAALAPLAAIIPLVNTGSNEGQPSQCGALLAVAHSAPKAPPPGQHFKPRIHR